MSIYDRSPEGRRNNISKLKISTFLFVIFISGFFFLNSADAEAASRVLITWQAQSFVPAEYSGKILPTSGTNIKAGLEVIKENKIQDLSKINIRWYLDAKLLTQGLGLKETSFVVNKGATYSHFVRAVIMDKEEVSGTADILIVNPKIAIKTPTPAINAVPLGKNIFQAIPYFFNITNLEELIFNWSVNNQVVKGNNFLELTLSPPVPLNQNLNIKVTAQNLKNDLEFGSKEINQNVQQ